MNEIDTLKSPKVGMLVGTVFGTATITGVYPNGNKRTGWVYLKYHTGKADNKPHRLALSRSQKGVWYLKYVREIDYLERDDIKDISHISCQDPEPPTTNENDQRIDSISNMLREINDIEITEIIENLLNKLTKKDS